MVETILEGVFAINKPPGLSSAQVLRDLQSHFNPSSFFAPYLAAEREKRDRENSYQHRRRRQKSLQVKIGHGGTLDPLATGILIAGVGKGTKHLSQFLNCTKTYEAVVLFGTATDTYDTVGRVVGRKAYEHVTREVVEQALGKFRGTIMQRPPLYSALHMDGKRLYDYAREGKELPREIPERQVEVSELEVMQWFEPGSHEWEAPEAEAGREEKEIAAKVLGDDALAPKDAAGDGLKRKASPVGDQDEPTSAEKRRKVGEAAAEVELPEAAAKETTRSSSPSRGPPAAKIRMTVSSGFYVRSLCHDLGSAVDSLALMAHLVRSRQGDFELKSDKVLEPRDLENGEEVWAPKLAGFLKEWDDKCANEENGNDHQGALGETTKEEG